MFLALRLTNDVINASDGDLKRAESLCEKIAVFFGGVIFVGIAFEIYLAFAQFPPATRLGHWGPVWADVLVAVGVGLEVLFGFRGSGLQSELTRRTEERLADAIKIAGQATERAAELQKKLDWRRVPREVHEALVANLCEKPGAVLIAYIEGDAEALFLARQIAFAFKDANWEVMMQSRRYPDRILMDIWLNSATSDGDAIIEAFKAGGISLTLKPIPDKPLEVGYIEDRRHWPATVMLVGSKAPWQLLERL